MGSWSIGHWLVVLLVVVLVFGSSKLANLGGDLGRALRGFKKGMHEDDKEPQLRSDPPPQATATPDATHDRVDR